MRAFTPREKRTLRATAIFLAVYLVLFYGTKAIAFLEEKRAEHAAAQTRALEIDTQISRELGKLMELERLRGKWRFDPARLVPERVVGDARKALLAAAQACGVALGSSRESPGRGSSRELATIQLDGQGPTPAAMRFLHSLRHLGFPLVIDRLEIRRGPKPGQVAVSFTVAVLDTSTAKSTEERDA